MAHVGTIRNTLFFTSALVWGACSTPKAEPAAAAPDKPTATPASEPVASEPEPPKPEPKVEKKEPPRDPADRRAHPALRDPSLAKETAPARYTVLFATTKGDVLIDIRRSWAPLGADRFYNLVKIGAFNDTAFFRVVQGFMAQIGIPGDPEIARIWRNAKIPDDPVTQSNRRGTITFATSGKDARVNQVFINFVDNGRLDAMGFAPIGVVRDMHVMDQIHSGYGESAPAGRGPRQARIQREGNAYLRAEFPELDYVKHARVTEEVRQPPKPKPSQ